MHKFLTLLEGGIIGAALLIIFDHVVEKLGYWSYRRRVNNTYSRPTYYQPTYRSYGNFRDDEKEEDE